MDTIENIKQNIRLMELRADQLDIPKDIPFFILKDKTINELVLIETSLKLQLATYYINKMNKNYINTGKKMSIVPLDLDTISKMSMRDIELYYYHFNLDYKYSVLARDLPNHKVADSYLATTDDLEVNYINMWTNKPQSKPMFHVDSLYSFIKNRR